MNFEYFFCSFYFSTIVFLICLWVQRYLHFIFIIRKSKLFLKTSECFLVSISVFFSNFLQPFLFLLIHEDESQPFK